MATYAIGDVQGCFDALQRLLEKIKYDPQQDQLWFVGDLVNRGDKSLEVLRFIKDLPETQVVLGNHDIHLLALASGKSHPNHTLHQVLTASDRDEIIDWLRKRPLLHYDPQLNYVMTHAGIYPGWDLVKAQQCAAELENALRNFDLTELTSHIYGNYPDVWREDLRGWDRLRFITNAFTRMRFCSPNSSLEFNSVAGVGSQPSGYLPWFKIHRKIAVDIKIVFGHWAALQGITGEPNIFSVDTGCVWGNCLTAMQLENEQRFSVDCKTV